MICKRAVICWFGSCVDERVGVVPVTCSRHKRTYPPARSFALPKFRRSADDSGLPREILLYHVLRRILYGPFLLMTSSEYVLFSKQRKEGVPQLSQGKRAEKRTDNGVVCHDIFLWGFHVSALRDVLCVRSCCFRLPSCFDLPLQFAFNTGFSCQLRKLRIPMASLEESHNPKRVEEDRG